MEKNRYKDLWNGQLIQILELLFDILLVVVTLFLGTQIDFFINQREIISWYDIVSLNIDSVWQVGLYAFIAGIFFRIYKTSVVKKRFSGIVISIAFSLLFTLLTLIVLIVFGSLSDNGFFVKNITSSFIIFGIQMIVFAIYKSILNKVFIHFNKRVALIFGPKAEVLRLAEEFYFDKTNLTVVKYLLFEELTTDLDEKMIEIFNSVSDVYITSGLNEKAKNKIVTFVLQKTYNELFFVPPTYEIGIQKTSFERIDDTLLFKAKTMHLSLEQRFLKRFFDFTLSLIGLIIAGIPMILIAFIVKVQDGGPVFYRQERLKRNNKRFSILKFRSMSVQKKGEEGAAVADVNDNRITKFGRFIRATRLDELPQLINILKGDMSIVGPRPLMISVVDDAVALYPEFAFRANVKPGLTGYAQVNGRYDTEAIERLRFDLAYVRNYSFWLDVKIMFLTLGIMFDKAAGLGRGKVSFLELLEKQNEKLEDIEYGVKIVSKK